jgi:NAD(P)H-quinone oxidoreductase subunit 5
MDLLTLSVSASTLAPPILMLITALICLNQTIPVKLLWKAFALFSGLALLSAAISPLLQIMLPSLTERSLWLPGLITNPLQSWMALLVQLLGTVIGVFSSRYLQGESGQARYITAFSGVLALVHMLLLADHWLLLITAWALIGVILQRLLCFYSERPFAMLAAHKKNIADRIADALLITAAGLAWFEIGSGSLSALTAHVAQTEISPLLHVSAVCLVLAVMIRTALFPVHGWLIQVMEAPTPVSALLHAGVVNLAGFVLIRFAPLLQEAIVARWLLVIFGMVTAILAGLVMLTRISIKVRLAWSTVAQMGFMILECGLGLYTLAAMHLLGHSLYKAHAFLSSSSIVQQYKLQLLRSPGQVSATSLLLAPAAAISIILLVKYLILNGAWPWWWSVILALAWAPLLWTASDGESQSRSHYITGTGMIAALTLLASLLHQLPFGTNDMADTQTGIFALFGMTLMYFMQVALKIYPTRMSIFQRWSYAGFYVDEAYTRLALKLWPIDWASAQQLPSKSLTTR